MNNFNKIFLIVKEQCAKQKDMAGWDCFDIIAKESGIPISMLPLYLDHLQSVGLIKYSIAEKYIHLTAFGKKQDYLTQE